MIITTMTSRIFRWRIRDVSAVEWALTEIAGAACNPWSFCRRNGPVSGVRASAAVWHITTKPLIGTHPESSWRGTGLCASNPLSTRWCRCRAGAALSCTHFCHTRRRWRHLLPALSQKSPGSRPQLTMDDGADLVSELHKTASDLLAEVIGGTEETTTGVIRLRAMAADKALNFRCSRQRCHDQHLLLITVTARPKYAGWHYRHQHTAGR